MKLSRMCSRASLPAGSREYASGPIRKGGWGLQMVSSVLPWSLGDLRRRPPRNGVPELLDSPAVRAGVPGIPRPSSPLGSGVRSVLPRVPDPPSSLAAWAVLVQSPHMSSTGRAARRILQLSMPGGMRDGGAGRARVRSSVILTSWGPQRCTTWQRWVFW